MNSRVGKKDIVRIIKDYTKTEDNSMQKWCDEPAWGEPLVGFSNGADPLYKFYKKDIGDFYKLPAEFLENKHPDTNFKAGKLTVISWILPQTDKTKKGSQKTNLLPKREMGTQQDIRRGI